MKEEEGEKEANGHHQRSVGWWAIVSLEAAPGMRVVCCMGIHVGILKSFSFAITSRSPSALHSEK